MGAENVIFINDDPRDIVSTISITRDGLSTSITVNAPLELIKDTYDSLSRASESSPEYNKQLNSLAVKSLTLANTIIGERQGRIIFALAGEFGDTYNIKQFQIPSEKLLEDERLQNQNRVLIEGFTDMELIGSILFSSALISQNFAEKVMAREAIDVEILSAEDAKKDLLRPVNEILEEAKKAAGENT